MRKGKDDSGQWVLLLAVFVIATCGLVYELVAGTLASYLLGDSITQFSTIIGLYLFSMGIGSWCSRYLAGNLLAWFVKIELLVGLVGGFSAALLFIIFPLVMSFQLVLYSLVFITGVLVGLEIPLLMRILKDRVEFKDLVSRVFTFDYIGALLASLLFPMLFVPHLGLIRTSLFFGLLNTGVGIYLFYFFRRELHAAKWLGVAGIIVFGAQSLAFTLSEKIMNFAESNTFNDNIVYSTSSPYQRIVVTRNKKETKLFLNGNLQFNSADEYRYHEALVHPALSSIRQPRNVLVMGGGDGLAVREILKYPTIETITLVDLDPSITRLFSKNQRLAALNQFSLSNARVRVINADAFTWARTSRETYDAAIIDFPDPSNFSIGKLYSNTFYLHLRRLLRPGAIAVIQATSPYVAPRSFWCVDKTLKASGFFTVAYHNFVPSFGEWGYVMAMTDSSRNWFHYLPADLRFASPQSIRQMLFFPNDMKSKKNIEINKLNNQALVNYFEEEWRNYQDI